MTVIVALYSCADAVAAEHCRQCWPQSEKVLKKVLPIR